jgi:hypothetical protein
MENYPSANKPYKVDIRRLKSFALIQLPKNCALRDILLSERDELDYIEFIFKVPIWMNLLNALMCNSF